MVRRKHHELTYSGHHLRPALTMNPSPIFALRTPAALCAFGFLAAMAAVLQFSFGLSSRLPGAWRLYACELRGVLKPLFARVFFDTVWICFLTAVFT